MASSPTTRNRFAKQGTGDNAGTWGVVLNSQALDLIDAALDGVVSVAVAGSDVTLTSTNYVDDQSRNRIVKLTGTPGATRNIIIPSVQKFYVVHNTTDAVQTVKTSGGVSVSVAAGGLTGLYCDGVDCYGGISLSSPLSISGGGTGATTPQTALAALGVGRSSSVSLLVAQSIPNGTVTAINWTQEDFDTDNFHSLVTNTNRLTVPAGVTYISLTVASQWASSSVGTYRNIQLRKNGINIQGDLRLPCYETFATISSGIIPASPGDYFDVAVSQDSGGALNFGPQTARFSIEVIS